jgi:ABC-type Fe3+-hydroxamate transport system substrate-binding protein
MTNFEKFPRNTNSNYSGTTLASWSRQQKIAMIAGFVLLGVLIALSACSKQSPKAALVGISAPSAQPSTPATAPTPTTPATVTAVAKNKTVKKRPAAIVTYTDSKTGVSFRYPRKYELALGEKVEPQIDGLGTVPMNFVQPGGSSVAMVAMPSTTYRGTDFTTAFFNVNVNRSLSEQ